MMDNPNVSIIIVNYNTKQLLKECIQSIIQQTKEVSYEIIVVDNDSCDGSQTLIRSEFPTVRLIESGGNLGFGKANNIGMKEARGKYLFLLNSDTILMNNAIKIFYDYSIKKDIGVLGSILIDRNLKPCHSYGNFITPTGEIKNIISKYIRFIRKKDLMFPSLIKAPMQIDYITGADIWLSKDLFEEFGGFDPDYFMYCEEVDWQYRMFKKGISRTIIPGPKIIHLEGGSDANKSNIWTPSRLKNIFISKNYITKKILTNESIHFLDSYILLSKYPNY